MTLARQVVHRVNRLATRHMPVKTVRSHLGRPLASVTFDDFPRSAWTAGGPLLARYGARGTYYAAGRFCGAQEDGIDYYDAEDLAAVRRAGHEVGAHSHVHQMATTLSAAALRADADRNDAALAEALEGVRLCSYAYPYGEVGPRAKQVMAARYATARGIRPGVNVGRIDLAQLRAVPLEARRWRPDAIAAAVWAAKAANGWLILFTHDVADHPSPFGCTPAMLETALQLLADAAIPTIPVKSAMAEAVFGTQAG